MSKSMKARIIGTQKSDVVDTPIPKCKDDWVLVKVHSSAMCTEYKSWLMGRKHEQIGHEGAGEVVEVAQKGKVKVGDRIVIGAQTSCGNCALCHSGDYIYCENAPNFSKIHGNGNGSGTFANYYLNQSSLCFPIPESVTYDQATMAIDGIGASFGGMEAIDLNGFDTVLITGLGPVGLGGIINARFRGARVIAVEPSPWRASLGLELGAEVVLNPEEKDIKTILKDLTRGIGVDCAVDCSGTIHGERLCIDAVRRRGRVSFVGENRTEVPIQASRDMIRKGLRVVGNWLYNVGDYQKVMQVIENAPLIDKLISHVLPLNRIQEGFSLLAAGKSAKIVLRPWE